MNTIVTAALAGGLAFGIGVPAQAAAPVCTIERALVSAAVAEVPAAYGEAQIVTPAVEAWTERIMVSPAVDEVSHVVHHPAVYTERVVVERAFTPATPAVDEVSHIVHHPAETAVVHHPAATRTVHHPAVVSTVHHAAETTTEHTRYSWTGGKQGPQSGETPETNPGDWQPNGKKYDGSPTGVVHKGNGNASFFYWTAVDVVTTPAWDEQVVLTAAWDEEIVVTAAWDENVVVREAWDEKVVDVAAQPEIPAEPEVSHVERELVSKAWDEKVIDVEAQDAVYAELSHAGQPAVFGERELISEAVPARPAVFHDVEVCVATENATLPAAPALPDAPAASLPTADGAGAPAETTEPSDTPVAEAPVAQVPVAPAPAAPAPVAPAPAVVEDVVSHVPAVPAPAVPVPAALPLSDGTDAAPAAVGIPQALALTGGGIAPVVPLGAGALIAGGLLGLLLRRSGRAAQD